MVESPATGNRFLIANRLGEGGYGCAYRVQRLDSWDRRIKNYCLKTTTDPESWHREAYFGELLNQCERAIRLYDSFPLFPATKRHGLLYCLVFEYAEHGTIRDHLAATKRGWSPVRARREIVALLKLLDQLHGAGALHRDITPTNVFVCKNNKLKLGDFGLARTVLAGKMLAASAVHAVLRIEADGRGREAPLAAVGRCLSDGAVARHAPARRRRKLISAKDAGKLPCKDDLHGIVAKAICARRNRFATALDMLRALQGHDYPEPSLSRAWKGRQWPSPVCSRFDDLMPRSWSGRRERPFRIKSRVESTSSSRGRRSHDYVDAAQGLEAAGRGEADPPRRADLDHQRAGILQSGLAKPAPTAPRRARAVWHKTSSMTVRTMRGPRPLAVRAGGCAVAWFSQLGQALLQHDQMQA